MAWAERTIHEVDDPPLNSKTSEEERLNRILKNMPPFIKLSSRRARKTLAKYEELKQRHIENLRNNKVFKFVMMVAGFTNENMQKYWKGSDVSPFQESYRPEDTKIDREEIELLVRRARERAFSDLHQFCRPIAAVPMYREAIGQIRAKRSLNMGSPKTGSMSSAYTPLSPDSQEYGGGGEAKNEARDITSKTKYIYNMSDMEFRKFCRRFTKEIFTRDNNDISRYVLGKHVKDSKNRNFDAAEKNNKIYGVREKGGVDKVFDEKRIFDENGTQIDSFDHEDPYVSLDIGNRNSWATSNPIVKWGDNLSVFSFQRYIARWLVSKNEGNDASGSVDLERFQNQYKILFNNLYLKGNEWIRDLSGLRLSKMIRGNDDGFGLAEDSEGAKDLEAPCQVPCEVPLDFVQPLFNERFSYWKHELVLGEYEKKTMYEADQWLQKTPWAIGKIYLQPNIYSHMQEAHIAISSRFKKFNGLSLQDWLGSEKHMFFYAKLVSLCIRTSAVLSNKKYGLDKAYMRLNLEKRRIMYSLGKMAKPLKTPVRLNFPRASETQSGLWEEYRAARARNDVEAQGRLLAQMR